MRNSAWDLPAFVPPDKAFALKYIADEWAQYFLDCKVEGILPEMLGVAPGPVARLWQRPDVTPSQSQSEPAGPGCMLVISWAYSIFSQKVLQGSAGWQAAPSYLLHRPWAWRMNVVHRVGNTVWIYCLCLLRCSSCPRKALLCPFSHAGWCWKENHSCSVLLLI